MERSILPNFANYYLNSLNGKLNGSRKNSICMGLYGTKNDQSGNQLCMLLKSDLL